MEIWTLYTMLRSCPILPIGDFNTRGLEDAKHIAWSKSFAAVAAIYILIDRYSLPDSTSMYRANNRFVNVQSNSYCEQMDHDVRVKTHYSDLYVWGSLCNTYWLSICYPIVGAMYIERDDMIVSNAFNNYCQSLTDYFGPYILSFLLKLLFRGVTSIVKGRIITKFKCLCRYHFHQVDINRVRLAILGRCASLIEGGKSGAFHETTDPLPLNIS